MSQAARTAATLAVLCALLGVGALWGWHATTAPLPGKVDSPICVPTTIAAGEKVYPEQVAVSVFNASTREGLAARTMQLFRDAGFVQGSSGNVNSDVDGVAIWTEDPTSPAVLVVASRLGPDVDIDERLSPGVGVTVVVGDKFKDLAKGKAKVTSKSDAEICSPPVS